MTKTILSRKAFWTLSFTWGLPMTLIGMAIASILITLGYKPQTNCYGWVFEIGERWGGISFGPFSMVQRGASQYIKDHEFGHAIQNCYLGILFPFVVAIPSGLRYQYHTYKERKDPNVVLPDYYSIWFEKTASEAGQFYRESVM